jgi:hypothetical protein
MRQGDPVFHLAPEEIDQISDQIVAHAATLADTGTGRVLVFRSTLDSLSVEPLAWRGSGPTAVLDAGAVLLGGALR